MPAQKKTSQTGAKSATSRAGGSGSASSSGAGQQDAVQLLKADHRKVEGLFSQYESASNEEMKQSIARQACKELIIHTLLEEEIFYPACREDDVEEAIMDEAQVEHDGAKIMINELLSQEPDSEMYDAKFKILSEYIKHHVGEEEKPSDGIFASAQKKGVDMKALGEKLAARKQELMARMKEDDLQPPMPKSLHLETLARAGRGGYRSQEDQAMNRQSNYRNRDEYGRFTDDDDDRRGRYSARSRDDDDDRDYGRGRGRSHGGWYGDSEGHSMAARSRSEGRYGSRRDYDDDDDRGGRGGGRGWYGDPEGHSEASREGWEHRGYRARGRDDDDDDDRDYGRGGGRGRSQGGWFGDSRGHAMAARRGWEERGGGRYSDDDDDRGRGRGRSQGGWFGDPEGHSEASRRGWRDRD
jgi:hemerythrin superfamily protein